jgi:hypothetical protein
LTSITCYECHQPGHIAANCPQLRQADGYDEHIARVTEHVDDWIESKTSIEEKRRRIGQENRLWYGESCPRSLRWPQGD